MPRIASLDVLRTLSILLVLCRHSQLTNIFKQIGWAGVDLFFVLSGFLIFSLMLQEYNKTNTINLKRFILRRSLKIFPPFYFYIACTFLLTYLFNNQLLSWNLVWHELCYLQSYLPGINIHTWSLAVEEHFYLLLALSMFILLKLGYHLPNRKTALFLVSLFVLEGLGRALFLSKQYYTFTYTHLRFDGLVIGMLVAYLQHYYPLRAWVNRFKYYLAMLMAVLFIPLFVYVPGLYSSNTLGLSSTALAFGILVSLSINLPTQARLLAISAPLRFIGKHSYSIYLWHLVADNILEKLSLPNTIWWQISIAIILGIAASLLIEMPILAWRNRVVK